MFSVFYKEMCFKMNILEKKLIYDFVIMWVNMILSYIVLFWIVRWNLLNYNYNVCIKIFNEEVIE